jgi:hypothetical protein
LISALDRGELALHARRSIALEIALRTSVLCTCPIHQQHYVDEDIDPSAAFSLAVHLVHHYPPYAEVFHHDAHELTDLLIETLSAVPGRCPVCAVVSAPSSSACASPRTRASLP